MGCWQSCLNECLTLLLPAALNGGEAHQPVSLQQFADGRTGFEDYLRQWRGPPEGLTGPQKTASRWDHFIHAPHRKRTCQDCNTVIAGVSTGIVCLAFCMTVPCTSGNHPTLQWSEDQASRCQTSLKLGH